MTNSKIICCDKCGKNLFYLSKDYSMSTKITCITCGNKKGKKVRRGEKVVKTATRDYTKVKGGVRKEVHPTYYFRSATEANFARLMTHFGISWTFEEKTFYFDHYDSGTGKGYKRPPYSYIMDFEITKIDKRKKPPEGLEVGWVEVKGYMDAKSRNKLRRLKKQHPEDAAKTTVIIYSKYKKKDIEFCKKLGYNFLFYDVLQKEYANEIEGWE